MREALELLQSANATRDAMAARAAGERRLIGIYGYTLDVPGIADSQQAARMGYRVIPVRGTGDALVWPSQRPFQELLSAYAKEYNRALMGIDPTSS